MHDRRAAAHQFWCIAPNFMKASCPRRNHALRGVGRGPESSVRQNARHASSRHEVTRMTSCHQSQPGIVLVEGLECRVLMSTVTLTQPDGMEAGELGGTKVAIAAGELPS